MAADMEPLEAAEVLLKGGLPRSEVRVALKAVNAALQRYESIYTAGGSENVRCLRAAVIGHYVLGEYREARAAVTQLVSQALLDHPWPWLCNEVPPGALQCSAATRRRGDQTVEAAGGRGD